MIYMIKWCQTLFIIFYDVSMKFHIIHRDHNIDIAYTHTHTFNLWIHDIRNELCSFEITSNYLKWFTMTWTSGSNNMKKTPIWPLCQFNLCWFCPNHEISFVFFPVIYFGVISPKCIMMYPKTVKRISIKKRRNQYVKWTNRFISIPSFYDVWTINVRNQFKFTRRHILNQKFSSMPTWRKMAIFEQKSEIFKLFQFNWKICLWRVLLATKMAHGKKEVEISWL